MSLTEQAKEIISRIIYITIATVCSNGKPWNTPVYAAYDDDYNFYWASWTENQHSQNIRKGNNIFLVIYDSTAPEGTGEGVYLECSAEELNDKEKIEKGLSFLYKRKNSDTPSSDKFSGSAPRRIYKATPTKVWMNESGNVDGEYVDIRKEIDLEKL